MKGLCNVGGLLDDSFRDVASLLAAATGAAPLVHQAVSHAVQVATVRFLVHLPASEEVCSVCYGVLISGGGQYLRPPLALALAATALSQLPRESLASPPEGFDVSSFVAQFRAVSSVLTPLLSLVATLISYALLPDPTSVLQV